MAASGSTAPTAQQSPLLSPKLLVRCAAFALLLVGATTAIGMAGRWYGDVLALGGHTASGEPHDIFIGQDHFRLPANVIRFDEQRRTGFANRVDLYATWPDMKGYSDASRARFNDIAHPSSLIFLQISQSTMSRDMSGRVEPIYRHLFEGAPMAGPAGLTAHRMKEGSGYGDETFFTGQTDVTGKTDFTGKTGGDPYAVRCVMPKAPAQSNSADCQRDIHAGKDVVVLYRFSSQLLPQWRAIDTAVRNFVGAKLVP